jgi:hypothetical protein
MKLTACLTFSDGNRLMAALIKKRQKNDVSSRERQAAKKDLRSNSNYIPKMSTQSNGMNRVEFRSYSHFCCFG